MDSTTRVWQPRCNLIPLCWLAVAALLGAPKASFTRLLVLLATQSVTHTRTHTFTESSALFALPRNSLLPREVFPLYGTRHPDKSAPNSHLIEAVVGRMRQLKMELVCSVWRGWDMGGRGFQGEPCMPVIPRPGLGRRGVRCSRRHKSDRFTEPCQQGVVIWTPVMQLPL